MFAQFLVAIFKMVIGGGLGAGINDLISCLILWLGYLKYNHCQMIVYVLF